MRQRFRRAAQIVCQARSNARDTERAPGNRSVCYRTDRAMRRCSNDLRCSNSPTSTGNPTESTMYIGGGAVLLIIILLLFFR